MSVGRSIAVGFLVGGAVAAWYVSQSGGSRLDALAKNSPEGTVALLAIDGLDEVAELSASALAALDSLPSMFLDFVPTEVTQGLVGGVPRVREILGFDPAAEGALAQTGIDFSTAWGLSIVDGDVTGALLQIPTLDEEVALGFVERILNATGVENSLIEVSGDTVLSIADRGLLVTYGDYLILVTSENGDLAGNTALYDSLVSGPHTFASSNSYRNLSTALGDEWSFVGVVTDQPFNADVPEWSTFGLGGIGMAVFGDERELGVTGVLEVSDSSSLRGYVNAIDGGDTLGHRLPGEPVALSKFALNLGDILEMPEVAMVLMLAQNTVGGLDVAGILNSQGGPFWSAVTADGVSWNHVKLSDSSLVEGAIETLLCPGVGGSMQSLATGERFCVSDMFVAGVLDNAFVLGTGEGALQALQAQGAPGYASQISAAQQEVSDSPALYATVINLNGMVDSLLAEPDVSRELGMAGMLAIGALRSYVPDYLKMDMNIDSQTFNFTMAVENEEDVMPSGATALAGAGLIGAVAIPYLMDSTGDLDDLFDSTGAFDEPAQIESAPLEPVSPSATPTGKGDATK